MNHEPVSAMVAVQVELMTIVQHAIQEMVMYLNQVCRTHVVTPVLQDIGKIQQHAKHESVSALVALLGQTTIDHLVQRATICNHHLRNVETVVLLMLLSMKVLMSADCVLHNELPVQTPMSE